MNDLFVCKWFKIINKYTHTHTHKRIIFDSKECKVVNADCSVTRDKDYCEND